MKKFIVFLCILLVLGIVGTILYFVLPYRAVDKYMNAQDDVDSEAIIELLPPAYVDYIEKVHGEGRLNMSDKPFDEMMASRYSTIVERFDFLDYYPEVDMKDDFKFTHKITSRRRGSKSEVKEFNEYVKRSLDIDMNAEKVVLVKYTYDIKVDKVDTDEEGTWLFDRNNIEDSGVCVKIDGKWYYLNNNGENSILWQVKVGLTVQDGVQWMYEWLND